MPQLNQQDSDPQTYRPGVDLLDSAESTLCAILLNLNELDETDTGAFKQSDTTSTEI